MELNQSELRELIRKITREVIKTMLELNISLDSSKTDDTKKTYKAIKELITEKRIEELYASGFRIINYSKGCIITPLAKDRARELEISILLE